jgi:hypothetical protein
MRAPRSAPLTILPPWGRAGRPHPRLQEGRFSPLTSVSVRGHCGGRPVPGGHRRPDVGGLGVTQVGEGWRGTRGRSGWPGWRRCPPPRDRSRWFGQGPSCVAGHLMATEARQAPSMRPRRPRESTEPGAVPLVVERDQSARRRRVQEDTRRSGVARRTGREVASGGEAVSASEVVSVATDASTTTAENVTRGRPTAPSRTGRPCASRTVGRSCRPDSRAARRPGVAGRRSETRTGTAVASDSWADARRRRSRREGEYGPARQDRLPLIAQSGPLWDTRFGSP